MEALHVILLLLLILCAVSVNLTGNLLRAVVIFMSFSSVMCILWITLQSPDLAITEAAVGAGVSGLLFLLTLHRIDAQDAGDRVLAGKDSQKEAGEDTISDPAPGKRNRGGAMDAKTSAETRDLTEGWKEKGGGK